MVVAYRRVGVVVVDVPLALRADEPGTVLYIAHVQPPLVLGRVRHCAVPADVHAQWLLQLHVLQIFPRCGVHGDAGGAVAGARRAKVVERVAIAVVGPHKRLPPHVVLEFGGGRFAANRDDHLHRDAAWPERQRARQAAHREGTRCGAAAVGSEELAVAVAERPVHRHLHVRVNRVHRARLAAGGDGEAGAQLREEPAVAVVAGAAVLRAGHHCRRVARIRPRLNGGPLLGHDALAIAADAARALQSR